MTAMKTSLTSHRGKVCRNYSSDERTPFHYRKPYSTGVNNCRERSAQIIAWITGLCDPVSVLF